MSGGFGSGFLTWLFTVLFTVLIVMFFAASIALLGKLVLWAVTGA